MIFHSNQITLSPHENSSTSEQKHSLELIHNTTGDNRVCDRMKAVLLASEATVFHFKL
ncbi:conserved hypothetical protein [Xenorhabdus cabanillasii JM26]|uniref:Uncharacterized protein n=1 Tax=Xenorhabdus cabanillasii JM26 TaxID=1427517 RepID=W1J330_9GAMM|nr:conserved hypothetical protein [Xenorhabdus cabanillasii JM26]